MISSDLFNLRIDAITPIAQSVLQFDLAMKDAGELPAYSPGAHIVIELPRDIRRSYSLLGYEGVPEKYQIAVLRETESRGGSAWLHDSARPGHVLRVAKPRNHFMLDEGDHFNILIAGGIGITPIWAMTSRLSALGRPWKLYYRARQLAGAALVDRLTPFIASGQVVLSFNDAADTVRPDLSEIARTAPYGAHLYCCGPASMVEAFITATKHLPSDHIHVERFSASNDIAALGGFSVKLAKSGKRVWVAPGTSILQAIRGVGIDIPSACEKGVCGACEIGLLEGQADHKDLVLTKSERAANTSLMSCCSGALTSELVLNL